jgi:transcriptional regulator with XRE-family HTH domain
MGKRNTQIFIVIMGIAKKILLFRKERGLTQSQLADAAKIHVNQIRRYETGVALPALDALKKIAIVLRTSIDDLVFEDGERDLKGELKRQFEMIAQMSEEDQNAIRSILDGMILKHQTKKLLSL